MFTKISRGDGLLATPYERPCCIPKQQSENSTYMLQNYVQHETL